MERWEHCQLQANIDGDTTDKNYTVFVKHFKVSGEVDRSARQLGDSVAMVMFLDTLIARLGGSGWELVSHCVDTDLQEQPCSHTFTYLFKRPVRA